MGRLTKLFIHKRNNFINDKYLHSILKWAFSSTDHNIICLCSEFIFLFHVQFVYQREHENLVYSLGES